MKFFKLIKSIDYVSYPTYKELMKISDAVSNSVAAFRNVLISAIFGVIFDKTPLSEYILTCIANKFPGSTIENIANYENSPVILSIIIAVVFLGIFKFSNFIKERWGSNKNTKKKRDILVHEFYNVAIPQLIEVKSMMEQIKDDTSADKRKKSLLLLQAKYEICDLHESLFDMNIIEKDKTGLQTEDSSTLSRRISRCAYTDFLVEMLSIMESIYKELLTTCRDEAEEDIEDIRATINSSVVFGKIKEISSELQNIKDRINEQSKNELRELKEI